MQKHKHTLGNTSATKQILKCKSNGLNQLQTKFTATLECLI